jgi:tRNA(adenine34) deaminase
MAKGKAVGAIILPCDWGRPRPDAMRPPSPLPLSSQQLWMERLLRLARRAGEAGEIPVAAVVLDGAGQALGWGTNRRQTQQDPLGHAELVALSQAARLLDDWRFNACSLLVTLEPCPMCAGALIQARMGRVVFAAADAKRGALGGCLDLAADPSAHHHMEVLAGVRGPDPPELLESWFRRRRRAQAIAAAAGD